MYKYTPDKNILRGLRKIRKEMYVNGKEYAYITLYAPVVRSYVRAVRIVLEELRRFRVLLASEAS